MRAFCTRALIGAFVFGSIAYANAQVTPLPFIVDSPTEAVRSAAASLSKLSEGERRPVLRIGIPIVNAFDFCEAIKSKLKAIYVAPISKYQQCDRELMALGAFDFPFIAGDWDKARDLLNGPLGLAVVEGLSKRGVAVLSFWDGGTSIFSAKKPIVTARDFRGLKVRTVASFSSTLAMSGSGAASSTIAGGEVYEALSRGLVEAADIPLHVFSQAKLDEVNKFVMLSNHFINPFVLTMPSTTFEELTATQRAFLDVAVRDATVLQIAEAKKALTSEIQGLRDKGVTVTPYTTEMARGFMTPQVTNSSLVRASHVLSSSSNPIYNSAISQIKGQQLAPYWKVFFATNRMRKGDEFTNDLSAGLLYGEADVEFKFDGPQVMPTLAGTVAAKSLVSFGKPGNDFVVNWTKVSATPFPKDFAKAPQSSPAKAPIIYVHGFANSFRDAARRAAWIGWNVKRPAVAFVWASQDSLNSYREDQATAAKSWTTLADLLSELGREYDTETDLDIVAHSMGAYVLLGALEEMQKRNSPGKQIRFRQLVMVAPDVPSDRLKKVWGELSKYFQKYATVYVSNHDRALGISRGVINPGEGPRAGLAPPYFQSDHVESIFIGPNDFSFTGHSYHVANGVIADDIVELLMYGTAANDRHGCGPTAPPDQYFVLRRLQGP